MGHVLVCQGNCVLIPAAISGSDGVVIRSNPNVNPLNPCVISSNPCVIPSYVVTLHIFLSKWQPPRAELCKLTA